MVNLGGGGGAPGKRTLTDELGAGDGAGAATSASDGGGSGQPEGDQIGELTAERIGADPDETGAGPDVPVRDVEGG
ncbi:MAG TPA: hypothetical protein VGD80_24340 [Kofleriaceae bacterium]